MTTTVSRREFLHAGAAAGAVLSLGVSLSACRGEAAPGAGSAPFAPDAWIRLFPDGTVLVEVARSEMGQGVSTALPMLVAEEMDADWSKVRFEFAPANKAYYNPLIGAQITGGSTAVMGAWVPLREAGAKARAMLVAAAAAEWGVAASQCRTESGQVIHDASGRRSDYGALAAGAAALPVPEQVTLKEPSRYTLIGKAVPRLDSPAVVSGKTIYGIDAGPEGALTALIARCPVFGGKVRSVDDVAARAVPGVRHVVRVSAGVAVVADGFWAASNGRSALKIEWDEGAGATLDSAAIEARLLELVGEEGRKARLEGQGAAALAGATKLVEADYHAPYLAHACMEPMNCTADVREDGVTLWVPTQAQAAPALFGGGSRGVAAKIAGVSEEKVVVHTTHLGGGFGRRSEVDYVAEAVEVSKEVRAPVKLIWTREDDIRHDFYRPVAQHRLKGGLDQDGKLVVWSHHVAAQSIMGRFIPGWVPDVLAHLAGPIKGGIDPSAVEGAVDLPYTVANHEVRYHEARFPVPIGFWRSVGHTHTAFAVECFVDELAAAAGKDPVQFRLDHLSGGSRERRVLEAATERAGWGTPLPSGRARGVAVHGSFGSYAAQVAEVRIEDGKVRVDRVVCAFDCGIVVNPEILTQQVEGAIVYGLSAALKSRITIRGGRTEQGNFDDYPMLSMAEMPRIEVILVPSGDAPGGAGEPATPPIAPAVANAVSALTGKRVRRLPIEV